MRCTDKWKQNHLQTKTTKNMQHGNVCTDWISHTSARWRCKLTYHWLLCEIHKSLFISVINLRAALVKQTSANNKHVYRKVTCRIYHLTVEYMTIELCRALRFKSVTEYLVIEFRDVSDYVNIRPALGDHGYTHSGQDDIIWFSSSQKSMISSSSHLRGISLFKIQCLSC